MGDGKAGAKRKGEHVGFRISSKKKRLVERKMRSESEKLDFTITFSNLMNSLLSTWLRNRGVPREIVADADRSAYHRMKDALLEDLNEWWYVHGHFEKNWGKVRAVYDELTPEGKEQIDKLMKRYEELQEVANEMFFSEEEESQ